MRRVEINRLPCGCCYGMTCRMFGDGFVFETTVRVYYSEIAASSSPLAAFRTNRVSAMKAMREMCPMIVRKGATLQ